MGACPVLATYGQFIGLRQRNAANSTDAKSVRFPLM